MDRLAKTTVRLADLKAAAPEGTELGEIGGGAGTDARPHQL